MNIDEQESWKLQEVISIYAIVLLSEQTGAHIIYRVM